LATDVERGEGEATGFRRLYREMFQNAARLRPADADHGDPGGQGAGAQGDDRVGVGHGAEAAVEFLSSRAATGEGDQAKPGGGGEAERGAWGRPLSSASPPPSPAAQGKGPTAAVGE